MALVPDLAGEIWLEEVAEVTGKASHLCDIFPKHAGKSLPEKISVVTGKPSPSSQLDHFDRLPDSLLLLVFNKIGDVKALGRCCVVSKRFHALIPQVDNVVVKVDCVISNEETGISGKGKGVFSSFLKFFVCSFSKPLQVLQHLLGPRKTGLTEVSHHSPNEVLKNFNEIQSLRIVLPGGELGIEEGVLLKWKADFGTTLESCVILGASSVTNQEKTTVSFEEDGFVSENNPGAIEDGANFPDPFYTNGGLKLRVVWTISSLIAASARHYLLQQIISDHPTLENLVLTDSDGQGVLSMNKEQLHELRVKPLSPCASSSRTQVPALNMKLWYAPYMELPGGMVLKGATLVAIRPSEQPIRKVPDGWVSLAFEEPFRTAASLLVKRRTYCLEMNSF